MTKKIVPSAGLTEGNVHYIWPGLLLKEVEEDLQTAEEWSAHKFHLLWLICTYMKRPETSARDKLRCIQLIYKYADVAVALREAGVDSVATFGDGSRFTSLSEQQG